MSDNLTEKTESPTTHRRAQARRDGNVARSPDLTAAATLLGGVILLSSLGPRWAAGLKSFLESQLSGRDPAGFGSAAHLLASCLVPPALGIVLVGLVTGLLQTGFFISPRPLLPDLSRVSPLQGIRQLFSTRGLTRLTMGIIKTALVFTAAAISVALDLPRLLGLVHSHGASLASALTALVGGLAIKIASMLLALGLLDYAWQWFVRERSLRMTRWELKEDLKRSEGDPLHKQRRAALIRHASSQRSRQDLQGAEVVLTSPAGIAVALKYDKELDAPVLLAKATGLAATRIRRDAGLRALPIIERPTLARSLFRYVEPRRPIPRRFYDEVAETLAYVYRLTGRKAA